MNRYRLHFEPEDIEANNPMEAISNWKQWQDLPAVRKVVPIDKDGFPVEMS